MQGQTASYVITSLVTAPISAALTTLANIKDDLDIEEDDNDARLTRYIGEESAGIARYCNRIFGLATWQDEFRPQRGVWGEGVRAANNPLKLTRWPLVSAVVSFTGNTHSSTLVDGIASTTGLLAGQPVFGTGIPSGTTIKTVMPYAVLLSAPATSAVSAVSLTAGMSVIETVAGVDTQLVQGTDFEVDLGSRLPGDDGVGAIYRLNQLGNPRTWSASKVTVIYQAGYTLPADIPQCGVALPQDLQRVCDRLVVARYSARDRDPLLRAQEQPGLGRTEYWIGASPGQSGPYPNDITAVLDKYRTPVFA